MDTIQDLPPQLKGYSRILFVLAGILFMTYLLLRVRPQRCSSNSHKRALPLLGERIPYFSNTWQFLSNHSKFLDRVSQALIDAKSPIIKFYLGPFQPVYVISGPANVQRLFSSPQILDGDWVHFTLMETQWGMSKAELSKFRNDTTGRHANPLLPAGSKTPNNGGYRYWRNHNLLYTRFLTEASCWEPLVTRFLDNFAGNLDAKFPPSRQTWSEVSLFDLLKQEMASAAITTLFGTRILDLNPGFVQAYWAYDEIAGKLIVGPPPIFQPANAAKKEALHAMVQKHIVSAWENYDEQQQQQEQQEQQQWDPHFGSRLSRESAIWLRSQGFSDRVAAGHTLATLFGLNGNTVPVTIWALIELLNDADLLRALREEIRESACFSLRESGGAGLKVVDGAGGVQKLVSLPLLQSVYVETMRLHVSFAVTRQVRPGAGQGKGIPVETIVPDAGFSGNIIEPGALVQTLSRVAHLDQDVWGVEGHPASEFYGYRHVKMVMDEVTGQKKRVFAMKARPSSFFAYGGGSWICPGRHFGKVQIMLTLAMLVMNFDLEFVEWMTLDGKPSDRAPKDDEWRYAGSIAMFPDRGVKIRLRRACWD